jgi:hypothetical protein
MVFRALSGRMKGGSSELCARDPRGDKRPKAGVRLCWPDPGTADLIAADALRHVREPLEQPPGEPDVALTPDFRTGEIVKILGFGAILAFAVSALASAQVGPNPHNGNRPDMPYPDPMQRDDPMHPDGMNHSDVKRHDHIDLPGGKADAHRRRHIGMKTRGHFRYCRTVWRPHHKVRVCRR